jgi:hypothetical protein
MILSAIKETTEWIDDNSSHVSIEDLEGKLAGGLQFIYLLRLLLMLMGIKILLQMYYIAISMPHPWKDIMALSFPRCT